MRIFKAGINLSKMIKENISEDKNGDKWLNFDIILRDEPNQFGKIIDIKQWNKETRQSEFIGGAKVLERKQEVKPVDDSKSPWE